MKLTSKRRGYLRSLAQNLEPLVRIGKEGVSENLIKSIDDVIKSRELIKIKVLQNCEGDIKELVHDLVQKSGSELVHTIGKTIVIFKENKEKPAISSKVKEIV